MTGHEKPPSQPEDAGATQEAVAQTVESETYRYERTLEVLNELRAKHREFKDFTVIDATHYFKDLYRIEQLYEALDEKGVEVAQYRPFVFALRLLAESIAKPIIIDSFTDNAEREAFRVTFEKSDPLFYSYVDQNDLHRINNINVAVQGFEFLEPLLSEFNEVLGTMDTSQAAKVDFKGELRNITRETFAVYKRIKDRDTTFERYQLITQFRANLVSIFNAANFILAAKLEELAQASNT